MSRAVFLDVSAVALCSLAIVGCGGGDEPPAPIQAVRKQNVPPVPAPAGAPAANPQGQPPAGRPANGAATPGSEGTAPPADADPNDLFVVVAASDTFEVVPRLGEHTTGEMLEVTPLPEGTTGSTFVIGEQTQPAGGTKRTDLTLPPNFSALDDYGYDERGYPHRIVCNVDKSLMALVPAGNFRQGSDDGAENARPAHSVFLDPYYIDVAEVTVAQYLAFRNTLSATDKRTAKLPLNDSDPSRMPVHGVRFTDAIAYAKWCGKELPTEAEWEKAARGTDGETPWGSGRVLFSQRRSPADIDPIMSFPQDVSPYGVWDMAGNVREWCVDWYEPDAYQTAFDRGETFENWTGPRQPGPEFLRVAKGNGPDWHVWHREGLNSAEQIPGVGFRCVLRGKGDARQASR